jgi:FKBP-type peptidyl-prolyl cis-trans isomerase FklB
MRNLTLALACALAVMSTLTIQAQDDKTQATKKATPAPASRPLEKKSEMTAKQKVSYGLGMDIGGSLKGAGLEGGDVDSSALAQAIADVLFGKETALNQEEQAAAMRELRDLITAKSKAAAAKKLEEGVKFLAANKKKPGIKTTKSGLQYEVIKSGKGPMPTKNDKVSTHYKGQLISGKVFDGSYKGKDPTPTDMPISFGVGGVIAGWTEALQLMKVGDKWRLFIPSELAYGESGSRGAIGPNETLIFEIELIAIQ